MKKVINVVIVGMGRGGTEALQGLNGLKQIKIIGVADINPHTRGMRLAQQKGIYNTHNYDDLLELPGVNVVIETTGLQNVQKDIRQKVRSGISIIEADAYNLIMLLIKDRENILEINDDLRSILDSAKEGIQFAGINGEIRYANQAVSHITGIPSEERIGENVYHMHPNSSLTQALLTKGPVKQWRSIVRGTDVEILSNSFPIVINGKMRGGVVYFSAVSDVISQDKNLGHRNNVVQDSKEQLNLTQHDFYSVQNVVGCSFAFNKVLNEAKKVAKTSSNVLIVGESGTGKEIIANIIHHESIRKNKPFIKINCAAIPESLLESELFGYEKGAFTGAFSAKLGKFEIAKNGTIFLDEIGDLSMIVQAKLLRVLQEKEIVRVGGTNNIRVNTRIVAATNRNLEKMVQQGQFRLDLYYRLNVFKIDTPPLRQRTDDIPLLVNHIIRKLNLRFGKHVMGVESKVEELFKSYSWPGNIRELENILERAMLMSEERHITLENVCDYWESVEISSGSEIIPLDNLERNMIIKALSKYGTTVIGKKEAAKALNISLSTLYQKLKQYRQEKFL